MQASKLKYMLGFSAWVVLGRHSDFCSIDAETHARIFDLKTCSDFC